MEQHTGYGAAKYINAKIKANGGEGNLPPQMFYTYYKKGYIKTTINKDGIKVASVQELDRWFEGYWNKKLANQAAKQEQVALELAGK